MSVFTRVTEAELTAWLKEYSLGSLLELQGIAAGIENTNYFVTTSNGRFVLTLFEKLSAKELPFYLNLMAHLARHGIPCPAPMADRHNHFLGELNGKPACIVSRLSGKSLTHPETAHCAAVGAMLGQMHIAGQSFGKAMANARAAEWRQQAAQQVRPFLNESDAALLDTEIAFHEQHGLHELPQGVVHADLFRDNVLFDGARIGGLIDFYFACNDSLLYDAAITANDWCMRDDGSPDAARTRALLAAYHAERPFTAREAELWPIALRAAALRFWISRLYDLHLPRDGEIIHAHDPDKFKHILQRHIAANGDAIWL
ncbi:MAG: homoserine kinase [Sideroxydans sp.]|nr:homoserine kinase [Sideroxydans sp.]